ncbi:hypothetical protein SACS_0225 [Parasaccharibacter apium]|uniref:Uncharacterized protein n=1 Tax=Parasaccharibacter apium TaxID=1510841 RepID=A0A7U7G4H0_9PROT|nr:hypothetical protein SACS_0225 [Parasaccharibacter apium]
MSVQTGRTLLPPEGTMPGIHPEDDTAPPPGHLPVSTTEAEAALTTS